MPKQLLLIKQASREAALSPTLRGLSPFMRNVSSSLRHSLGGAGDSSLMLTQCGSFIDTERWLVRDWYCRFLGAFVSCLLGAIMPAATCASSAPSSPMSDELRRSAVAACMRTTRAQSCSQAQSQRRSHKRKERPFLLV